MDHEMSLKEMKKEWHGSLRSYAIGFFSSLFLTLCSFGLVFWNVLEKHYLIYAILGLGFIQAIVQLIYFLHLGQEEKPRWQMGIFFFMVTILVIIVAGSLWIMDDLNTRVMLNMHKEMAHHD